MIYHSTHSDTYLFYLILQEEQKEKNCNTPEYKVPPEQKRERTQTKEEMKIGRRNMNRIRGENYTSVLCRARTQKLKVPQNL